MAKVLLYALDKVGKSMAGPAIRYWEFAKALSKKHEVILLVPNELDISSDEFTIIKRSANFRKYFKQVDVIITMLVTPSMAWSAKKHGVKIILDAYDPMPFELMELDKASKMNTRQKNQWQIVEVFNFSFKMADHVICAHEGQRDLWTGVLLSQKKINPSEYDKDTSLKQMIDIVPFGLPSAPPVKQGIGPRSLFKLKESDKIVLWGGGIFPWFDPLTLIDAIHLISKDRADVHLVFMGANAPAAFAEDRLNAMSVKAQKYAQDLGMFEKHVFFKFGWTPYEQRTSFLLESDVGISTHFDHLETRYSFRTRLLDYIWAGLPIISTEGDSFSKLIASREVGLTVSCKDAAAVAKAILHIVDNPQISRKMRKNQESLKAEFYWEKVVQPIEKMIAQPFTPKRNLSIIKDIIRFVYHMRGPLFPLKIILNRAAQRLGRAKVR